MLQCGSVGWLLKDLKELNRTHLEPCEGDRNHLVSAHSLFQKKFSSLVADAALADLLYH